MAWKLHWLLNCEPALGNTLISIGVKEGMNACMEVACWVGERELLLERHGQTGVESARTGSKGKQQSVIMGKGRSGGVGRRDRERLIKTKAKAHKESKGTSKAGKARRGETKGSRGRAAGDGQSKFGGNFSLPES